MTYLIVLILTAIIVSTLMYFYLHKKTGIRKKFIFEDNIGVIILSILITELLVDAVFSANHLWFSLFINVVLIGCLGFSFTMIRFWRKPIRKINTNPDKIVSPADGNVIYIKKIGKVQVPISVKNKKISTLNEITKTELLETPCWLLGINMTPFDVHKNCAPIDGEIHFQEHTPGVFFSLKSPDSETENERNTFVIKNNNFQVGIVQIASKLVRGISTYKKKGDEVNKGDWIGMIRFGSQVDVIIPDYFNVIISLKEQIYAGKTVIAEK